MFFSSDLPGWRTKMLRSSSNTMDTLRTSCLACLAQEMGWLWDPESKWIMSNSGMDDIYIYIYVYIYIYIISTYRTKSQQKSPTFILSQTSFCSPLETYNNIYIYIYISVLCPGSILFNIYIHNHYRQPIQHCTSSSHSRAQARLWRPHGSPQEPSTAGCRAWRKRGDALVRLDGHGWALR